MTDTPDTAPDTTRPDAGLGLDGVPHTGEAVTADGHLVEPHADDFRHARSAPKQPDWYKTAVFYEVLVRAFNDFTNDGTGDLRGLADKLDYLQWLGVDCLWLPPFYASPLRDGGYDISDFRAVLPEFGTVEDFVYLLDQAHRRGLRVITDLVLNHTSDQHPWFQESRQNPDGPYGDYYVWSDNDEEYPDARIIFVDTESSNWTYDPVRGQFYWHRFFSHQPDLNFENPEVGDAMIDVLRFWLDIGIDGFRLDAVPYLFEEEGTNCENLPRTHEFLKRCRKVVDDEYPGRVLLAEANQWPADVVAYFGDAEVGGDECHMAFHFPLMPRIFMAVRRESRFPISEILAQTPPIPSGAQWGIFLRNHDELTLEMVTDEERDYMYSEYAKDPRMKANIGIRRRLAPLLDNDDNQMELFTAMLLSLPGSPVLYYGDEIGMGDNIWLGDRDAVRTPMQWSPDRNAGFSRADPGRMYLPVIADPVYGYQAVNVEAQLNNTSSLLHWTRRMLQVRREHPAFGLGEFTESGSSNPSVLAYLRHLPAAEGQPEDLVICVNNLSRFPQPVELDLSAHAGRVPVELTGGVRFPAIGELPYLLTLPGHGFYWFQLTSSDDSAVDEGETP
jgi:maltose alpha-D-glucosyltransferase/alpha-amylase